MIIDFKSTKIYLISPGVNKYRDRLYTVFSRLVDAGFQQVEFIKSQSWENPTTSLAKTVLQIFQYEMNQDRPFMILEDDCALFHKYDAITIPDDCCMLYLGVSMWMYPHDTRTLQISSRQFPIEPHTPIHIFSYDENLTRIKGMTGTHAILYRSRDVLKHYIDSMTSTTSCAEGTPHDLIFASLQLDHTCYGLKRPMFYQDKTLGGQEDVTKLEFKDGRYQMC